MGDNSSAREVVNRLNLLRVRYGLTIQQMAERCGLPKSSLESYMKVIGAKRPGLDALVAIADAMDVSIDWLVGRTDDSFSPKLNREEYALACFNAAVRTVWQVREIERKRAGSSEPVEEPSEELYTIAARAMHDFTEAIRLFQQSGPDPNRQAHAEGTVGHFTKTTGN